MGGTIVEEKEINPNEGRTIVYKGIKGEIVISSSFKEDTLDKMSAMLNSILNGIELKGGDVSYVS